MKKDTMIGGVMIAVAIVGAGYLYGDKIANKIGIDFHKPKAQVEEVVDKKAPDVESAKTAPSITENTSNKQSEIAADGYHQAVSNFLNAKCNTGFTFKDALNAGMKEWTVKYEDGYIRLKGKTNPVKFDSQEIVIWFKTNENYNSFDPYDYMWLSSGKKEGKGFARQYWATFCKDAYNRSH